jgi:CRISPR-associated protein Cmr1
MGSLRWWYEVMVRSVGGTVCDPTQHACLYDKEKPPYYGLCDVCRVFGATGWARRFKLRIEEATLRPIRPQGSSTGKEGNLIFTVRSASTNGHDSRWYLPGNPLSGHIELKIIPTSPILSKEQDAIFDLSDIGALFQFIADWASLGAKPQMGMGVVELVERRPLTPLIDHLKQLIRTHTQQGDIKQAVDETLPCLQNMFFAAVDIPSTSVLETFKIKYDLRAALRDRKREDPRFDDDLRHMVMGYVRGNDRWGAKIMISYPYTNGKVRLWGWIPELNQGALPRSEILNEIYYFLEDAYGERFTFWLDYNPENHGTILDYLEKKFQKEAH